MKIDHTDALNTGTSSSPHVRRLAQCGLALQVAAVEWDNSDIDDTTAISAFETIVKEAQTALKALKKEFS